MSSICFRSHGRGCCLAARADSTLRSAHRGYRERTASTRPAGGAGCVCGACVEEPGRPPGTDAFAPASGMRANGGGGVRGVSVGRARSDRRRVDRARSGIERTFAGNDAARETAGVSGRAKTRAAARRPRHTRETRTFGLARAEHRALCSSQGASRVVDWRRRGNSARARKRASKSNMARGVSRFRRQCGSRFLFATGKRMAKTARARSRANPPRGSRTAAKLPPLPSRARAPAVRNARAKARGWCVSI